MFVTVSALPLKVAFPLSPDLSDNQMSPSLFHSLVLITSSTSAIKAYSGLFPHLTDKKKFILSLKNRLKHWDLSWKLKMGQFKECGDVPGISPSSGILPGKETKPGQAPLKPLKGES